MLLKKYPKFWTEDFLTVDDILEWDYWPAFMKIYGISLKNLYHAPFKKHKGHLVEISHKPWLAYVKWFIYICCIKSCICDSGYFTLAKFPRSN